MKYLRYVVMLAVVAVAFYATILALDDNRGVAATMARLESIVNPIVKIATNLVGGGSESGHSSSSSSTKIEIPGVIKLDIGDDENWSTVGKILVIILGASLGGKLLNNALARKREESQK